MYNILAQDLVLLRPVIDNGSRLRDAYHFAGTTALATEVRNGARDWRDLGASAETFSFTCMSTSTKDMFFLGGGAGKLRRQRNVNY